MDRNEFEEKYRVKDYLRGSFHDILFDIIDERGLSNKEVYLKCNMDRKRFSKIQCTSDVKPSKRVVLALCVGLGLTMEESVDLLSRADKALNPNDQRDQYVVGFIEEGCTDINIVNEFLSDKELEILGCV